MHLLLAKVDFCIRNRHFPLLDVPMFSHYNTVSSAEVSRWSVALHDMAVLDTIPPGD